MGFFKCLNFTKLLVHLLVTKIKSQGLYIYLMIVGMLLNQQTAAFTIYVEYSNAAGWQQKENVIPSKYKNGHFKITERELW